MLLFFRQMFLMRARVCVLCVRSVSMFNMRERERVYVCMCVRACVLGCVLACVRACARACLRSCVRVCACLRGLERQSVILLSVPVSLPTACFSPLVWATVILYVSWKFKCFCSDRLVGLVVGASASRAEDPGFESRLRRDVFGIESYQ